MKRLLIIIMIFLFTGCNINKVGESNIKITNNEVNLIIKDDTLTNDDAVIIFVNNSPKSIIYNNDFYIERKIDDEWFTLKKIKKDNTKSNYQLNQDEFVEFKINWTKFYDKLESGLYRLIKSYKYNNSKEDLYIAIEFYIN